MQRNESSRCAHATPAGLPCGIPGDGEEIDGAIQQAAQPTRQSISIGTPQHQHFVLTRVQPSRGELFEAGAGIGGKSLNAAQRRGGGRIEFHRHPHSVQRIEFSGI